MTETPRIYVILRKRESGNDNPVGTSWIEAGRVEASSASSALRSLKESALAVAVPARSWRPMRVAVHNEPRTKVEAAT